MRLCLVLGMNTIMNLAADLIKEIGREYDKREYDEE